MPKLPREKVSVICTVRNEAASLPALLRSLAAQSRPPDEVVLCDAGSSDATASIARSFSKTLHLRFIVSKGANIAKGRNAAIRAARSSLIASIDGGCIADRDWLEHLLATRAKTGADVVAGTFQPMARSAFGSAVGLLICPNPAKLPADWPPSSRSALYTKAAWRKAGGYPEDLYTAEDTMFNRRLKAAGFRYAIARDAFVRWQQRETPRALWRQFYLYGRGDGQVRSFSGFNGLRSLAVVAAQTLFILALLASLLTARLGFARFLTLLLALYLFYPAWRLSFRHRRSPSLLLLVPLAQLTRRAAYAAGFWRGLFAPRTGQR